MHWSRAARCASAQSPAVRHEWPPEAASTASHQDTPHTTSGVLWPLVARAGMRPRRCRPRRVGATRCRAISHAPTDAPQEHPRRPSDNAGVAYHPPFHGTYRERITDRRDGTSVCLASRSQEPCSPKIMIGVGVACVLSPAVMAAECRGTVASVDDTGVAIVQTTDGKEYTVHRAGVKAGDTVDCHIEGGKTTCHKLGQKHERVSGAGDQ
jgi:hypothetical protein